jgi:hypothetical protein
MTTAPTAHTFRNDAEGYVEVIELYADGDTILWDVRFPTLDEAEVAVATSKRRIACRKVWGLA